MNDHETDDDPVGEVVAGVKADLVEVPWHERAVTMLLTVGVLVFGIMLGAHIMAADLLFGTRLPPFRARYDLLMRTGMWVAGGTLVLGIALDARYTDD